MQMERDTITGFLRLSCFVSEVFFFRKTYKEKKVKKIERKKRRWRKIRERAGRRRKVVEDGRER